MKFEVGLLNLAFRVPGWSAWWFFLAAIVLAWSWFNPYVFLPWSDFSKDSYIALCFIALGLVWFWRFSRQSFHVSHAAWGCAGLICIVTIQYGLGYFAYGEHALWAIAALSGCALICILAAKLSQSNTGHSLTALLCIAVILAALLHLGVAIAQRFGWMPYDDINLPGLLMAQAKNPMRPGGNFGQPNLFATFMLWALLASGWMFSQRHLGRVSLYAMSMLFCSGVAMSQSRVAVVSLMVLLVLSLLSVRRLHEGRELFRWILGCLAFYALSTGALIWHTQWTDTQGLRSEVFSDPVRAIIYSSYFQASLLKPWLGWGMTHLVQVQWTVWPYGAGSGILFLHAHNIVLDLALWVGWPTTLVLVIWLGWRAWRRLFTIEDLSSWCAYATVAVLFTHACFELPHMLAFFFLPAAWWVGVLSHRAQSGDTINRASAFFQRIKFFGAWGFAASAGLAIYLAVMIWEYHRIEPEFWRIRFEDAKIGKPQPHDLPSTLLLTPLADRILLQDIRCKPGMSLASLAQLERSTMGFPSLYSMYLTACAFGMAGLTEQAQTWMLRFNRIARPEQVEHYAKEWDKLRRTAANVPTLPWPKLQQPVKHSKENQAHPQ